MIRWYLAFRPEEIRRIYELLDRASVGSLGHGPIQLLIHSAAILDWIWDPVLDHRAPMWTQRRWVIWCVLLDVPHMIMKIVIITRMFITFVEKCMFPKVLHLNRAIEALISDMWSNTTQYSTTQQPRGQQRTQRKQRTAHSTQHTAERKQERKQHRKHRDGGKQRDSNGTKNGKQQRDREESNINFNFNINMNSNMCIYTFTFHYIFCDDALMRDTA